MSADPRLVARGVRLEWWTLAWNVVEIGFLVAAAVGARSVGLAGFAADSLIEIFASVVVLWELTGTTERHDEARALRRIGLAFLGLSAYITVQSVATLVAGIRPDPSRLGIAWLAATVVVMLGLAAGKHRTGGALRHPVLLAEAKVTVVDGLLAAAILAGLVLNAAAGWWWADVAAGGVLVVYGAREGLTHLRAG